MEQTGQFDPDSLKKISGSVSERHEHASSWHAGKSSDALWPVDKPISDQLKRDLLPKEMAKSLAGDAGSAMDLPDVKTLQPWHGPLW